MYNALRFDLKYKGVSFLHRRLSKVSRHVLPALWVCVSCPEMCSLYTCNVIALKARVLSSCFHHWRVPNHSWHKITKKSKQEPLAHTLLCLLYMDITSLQSYNHHQHPSRCLLLDLLEKLLQLVRRSQPLRSASPFIFSTLSLLALEAMRASTATFHLHDLLRVQAPSRVSFACPPLGSPWVYILFSSNEAFQNSKMLEIFHRYLNRH